LTDDPKELAEKIKAWETRSRSARDELVNGIFGDRLSQSKKSGMQGIVYNAMCSYLPRGWELPPFKRSSYGLDENRLFYPWFFGNIQQIIPIASPAGIKIRALPLSVEKKRLAAAANAILDEECEYLNFDLHNQSLVTGAKMFGSQIGYYDCRMDRGPMQIQRLAELCDPLSVLWEPEATSIEDSSYIIYKRWSSIESVRRMYAPDFDVKPEDIGADFSTQVMLSNRADSTSEFRCVETIVFLRDPEEIEQTVPVEQNADFSLVDDKGEEYQNDDGTPITVSIAESRADEMRLLKYPYGRIIVLVNDRVVSDSPNEKRHHKCPFIKLDNYPIPFSFWGLPEYMAEGDMPHVINECVSALAKSARNSFKKLAVDTEKMKTKKDEIENDPDMMVEVEPNCIGKWAETIDIGGLGPQYPALLQSTMILSDKATGVTDPLRGNDTASVTSGKQQEILTRNATLRISPFIERLTSYLRQAGEIILSNAVDYRSPDEVFEIASNAGEPSVISLADFPRDEQFKIKIVPQSGLPTDRQERLRDLLDFVPKILQVSALSPEFADSIVKLTDIPELEQAWQEAKAGMQSRTPLNPSIQPEPTQTVIPNG